MLTRRQKELLDFIRSYRSEYGYPPSYDEMLEAMNLRSKSGIFSIVTGLEERGFIRRIPNRARAIEIIEPEGEAMRHLRRIVGALTAPEDDAFDIAFDRAVTDAQTFLRGVSA